jgi:aminoglycoside 2'-N-acetyltransferase I
MTAPDGSLPPAASSRVRVESYPAQSVPPGLLSQVAALREEAWPAAGDDPGAGPVHDPVQRPVSMLLTEAGTVVAALDILTKNISHCGQDYLASGLSTVVTCSTRRRSGYGRQLVSAARALIAASGADLGIFTCDRPLQAFYASAGWEVLDGAVLIGGTPDNPLPSDQFDKVTVAAFFSARARRHAASFTHGRIGLYPGDIDRLW